MFGVVTKPHFPIINRKFGVITLTKLPISEGVPLILFQDFRNYRYSLPMVPGLTVDLEAQRTLIKIPTTGYNEVRVSV